MYDETEESQTSIVSLTVSTVVQTERLVGTETTKVIVSVT